MFGITIAKHCGKPWSRIYIEHTNAHKHVIHANHEENMPRKYNKNRRTGYKLMNEKKDEMWYRGGGVKRVSCSLIKGVINQASTRSMCYIIYTVNLCRTSIMTDEWEMLLADGLQYRYYG